MEEGAEEGERGDTVAASKATRAALVAARMGGGRAEDLCFLVRSKT